MFNKRDLVLVGIGAQAGLTLVAVAVSWHTLPLMLLIFIPSILALRQVSEAG